MQSNCLHNQNPEQEISQLLLLLLLVLLLQIYISIKRDVVLSLWNNICFSLHRRIRGFTGKNILASYSKSTPRRQRSTSNMCICTCLVYDHFCSGVNQEQCSRHTPNTHQCSSLISYKNPADIRQGESAIRPCPRSPRVHMLLFITKYDLSA